MVGTKSRTRPPRIAWHWQRFAYGLVLGLPAALLIPFDPQLGIPLAVGVLPAAAIGLPPARRVRVIEFAVSVLAGMSLLVGSVLGLNPVLAIAGLFVLGIAASFAASRLKGGRLGLLLAVPLMGMGLSFDPRTAVSAAGLMAASGAYAWLVSLLWPEQPAPAGSRAAHAATPADGWLGYGILLGLAGATAAAIGFAFGFDHKGWMCGAALLVMRPDRGQLVARSLGRAGSVTVGALLGSAVVASTPAPWVLAIAILLALAGLAGTTGSRWYVTPAFTTFVVFILLLWDHPSETAWRFAQRNLETVLGVAVALTYGVLVPLIIQRLRSRSDRRRSALDEPEASSGR